MLPVVRGSQLELKRQMSKCSVSTKVQKIVLNPFNPVVTALLTGPATQYFLRIFLLFSFIGLETWLTIQFVASYS